MRREAHSEVAGRKSEKERGPGSAFVGVPGGDLGFHSLTLYW